MALLRVQHANDLPDPGSLAKQLDELAARGPVAQPASSAQVPAEASAPVGMDWPALINTVDQSGQLRLAQLMHDWVRVASLIPGELTYALAAGYSGDPTAELRDALLRATGERWQVTRIEGEAAPALRETAEAAAEEARKAVLRDPLVEAAMAAFPNAELLDASADARVAQGSKWRN